MQERRDPSEAAAWPGSSARGGHELVTSHNSVDPGRAEGLTRGPAGLVPGHGLAAAPAAAAASVLLRLLFPEAVASLCDDSFPEKGGVLVERNRLLTPVEVVFRWRRRNVVSTVKRSRFC